MMKLGDGSARRKLIRWYIFVDIVMALLVVAALVTGLLLASGGSELG